MSYVIFLNGSIIELNDVVASKPCLIMYIYIYISVTNMSVNTTYCVHVYGVYICSKTYAVDVCSIAILLPFFSGSNPGKGTQDG